MLSGVSRDNNNTLDNELNAPIPGQINVIKRTGTVVPYTDDKIAVAISKAFLAVEGDNAAASSRIHDAVKQLTEMVTATFKRRMPSGGVIHIEDIQDRSPHRPLFSPFNSIMYVFIYCSKNLYMYHSIILLNDSLL